MSRKKSYMVHVLSKPRAEVVADDTLVRFAEILERDAHVAAPIAGANAATRTIGMTASVDAADPQRAFEAAFVAFLNAAARAGLDDIDFQEASVELGEDGDYDRHELVGASEIGRRLGVTRERIRQLATAVFPAPVGRVGTYSVWRWGDIADWAAARNRKPGRPRRKRASAA